MSRDPATPAELHAALVEVAESSIAMYQADRDLERVLTRSLRRASSIPAEHALAEAQRRHRAATANYAAIRPVTP